jgi:hypothetical protein
VNRDEIEGLRRCIGALNVGVAELAGQIEIIKAELRRAGIVNLGLR